MKAAEAVRDAVIALGYTYENADKKAVQAKAQEILGAEIPITSVTSAINYEKSKNKKSANPSPPEVKRPGRPPASATAVPPNKLAMNTRDNFDLVEKAANWLLEGEGVSAQNMSDLFSDEDFAGLTGKEIALVFQKVDRMNKVFGAKS